MKYIPLLLLLCACTTPRKPCQVERICFEHKQAMLETLKDHPRMMQDILKTIAELENETGHYH